APGSLLINYRAIHAALHSRFELARAGFGSQSVAKLLEVSRRIAAVDFVAYMLLFDDLHSRVLYGRGQVLQSGCMDMWAVESTLKESHTKLVRGVDQVRQLSRLTTVCLLLKSYVSHHDTWASESDVRWIETPAGPSRNGEK
ncbi:unnamed protein product, partial [Symbiodinium sp. CCMP2592]